MNVWNASVEMASIVRDIMLVSAVELYSGDSHADLSLCSAHSSFLAHLSQRLIGELIG